VILRVVRTRVRRSHEQHVLDVMRELTASMGSIPGLRSAEFGRALLGEDMWFVAITRWDGIDAIQAVYGKTWSNTSILPGAEQYIEETLVEHFETTLDDLTEIVEERGHEGPG
jgi:antibiotic biosynthesis monooxygenase (ABM) superfamily enzyme